jgi:hypothetical protein
MGVVTTFKHEGSPSPEPAKEVQLTPPAEPWDLQGIWDGSAQALRLQRAQLQQGIELQEKPEALGAGGAWNSWSLKAWLDGGQLVDQFRALDHLIRAKRTAMDPLGEAPRLRHIAPRRSPLWCPHYLKHPLLLNAVADPYFAPQPLSCHHPPRLVRPSQRRS